jgi:c-di-GMP-binding flagellar brake protein YcgR
MVKQSSVEERRQAIRAKRILSIQFRLAKSKFKESDKSWHLSTTYDMSVLGLSFLSEVSFGVEDTLELHVVMSGVLDIFKGYGKVVRVERKESAAFYLVAVKFIENKALTQRKSSSPVGNRIRKVTKSK